ncbi:MAG TPA: phage tail sheath family protein, partial [Planctomycetes bacterium]|nr:phage tail sheath family protein [Planctomycetota bacterium]
PEQAFFVRCDEDLNPPEVREAGEFHVEIGVAAVRPAEFIVFRIGQQAKDIITEEPVS